MTISNNPPASEAFAMAINDLFAEAKNFLDGNPIENEAQANALGDILSGMKELLRDAERTRKAEKQPHLDAGKAVDAKWKEVQEPAKLTIEEATKPLTVWRNAQQLIKDAEAKKLREEVEAKEMAAREARENAASLEDAEEAEKLIKRADIAKKTANKIECGPSGLRTSYVANVIDYGLLLKWIKENRPDELRDFLNVFANRNIELAKAVSLPGVEAEKVMKAS